MADVSSTKVNEFVPIETAKTGVSQQILTPTFPTSSDKVKVAFLMYNNLIKSMGAWKENLGLAVGFWGLVPSISFDHFQFLDCDIPQQTVKTVLGMCGIMFGIFAVRGAYLAYKNKNKLTYGHFEEQLRAASPDVE